MCWGGNIMCQRTLPSFLVFIQNEMDRKFLKDNINFLLILIIELDGSSNAADSKGDALKT